MLDLKHLLDLPQLRAWAGDAFEAFLIAVTAHHGRTPDLNYRPGPEVDLLHGWTGRGREPRRRLAELVDAGRMLFAEAFADEAPPLPTASAFQHLFAGLLMLADWLGSADEVERFPFAEIGDPPRAEFVRDRAPHVLAAISLIPPTPPQPLPPFAEQFPFFPRAAQRAIDGLPLPDAVGSVVLLESETGSDTTEAGIALGEPADRCGIGRGLLFSPCRYALRRSSYTAACRLGSTQPMPCRAITGWESQN